MKTSLHNFREHLLQNLLDFLWRQWAALGVAGHAHSEDPWIVDPEALLLLSTVIARHDSRLFDEILDWLHTNGTWINLQRLGGLHRDGQLGDANVLAAIAEHLSIDSAHLKWKVLAQRTEIPSPTEPSAAQPLFPGVPVLREPDPVFLKRSLARGPIELRRMSQSPRPDKPATFLFKLRALFGRQARAEVLAWLLAHPQGHPAEIGRQTGYFRRSVQIVLNDLAESGHVSQIRVGREKSFAIRHHEWRFLLTWPANESFPQWICWTPIFRAFQILFDALGQPDLDSKSLNFQVVKLREALNEALPGLSRIGMAHQLTSLPGLSGEEFIRAVLHDLETLLP